MKGVSFARVFLCAGGFADILGGVGAEGFLLEDLVYCGDGDGDEDEHAEGFGYRESRPKARESHGREFGKHVAERQEYANLAQQGDEHSLYAVPYRVEHRYHNHAERRGQETYGAQPERLAADGHAQGVVADGEEF